MRRGMAGLVLVLLLAVNLRPALAAPAAGHPSSDSDLARALDAWAKPLVARGDLSGQLLVARRGRVILERKYGWADVELRAPMTPETRLAIASITKPMTVMLAFREMERHAIGYHDSIARWIPDFPEANRITIATLLRHRSGIPHQIVPDSEAVRPRTAAEMVERAKHEPLDFEPDAREQYSTGGFTVLARVLELASGRSYDQLLDEELFGPLGMTHSTNSSSRELLPGRAHGYVPGPQGIENAALQDFSGLVGGGSVWSTARDLHRFVQAIVTGELGEVARVSWVRNGQLSFNGRVEGFTCYATWDSTTDLEVTFLANLVTGAPDLLRDAVVALAGGGRPPAIDLPALAATPLDAEAVRRVLGSYRLENGTVLRMWARGAQLYSNDWPLLPTVDGALFSPRDYGLIRMVAGDDGRIARLDWTQRGQVYPAPRVPETR